MSTKLKEYLELSQEEKDKIFTNYGLPLREAENQLNVKQQLAIVRLFVDDVFVEGKDYGKIPGAGDKPTLLKPGAEKFAALYGADLDIQIIGREFMPSICYSFQKKNYKTNKMEDIEHVGCFVYEVKVDWIDRESPVRRVIGSGVGAGNSFEKKFASNGDAFQTQNTVLKMTKKRGLVDVALSRSMVSELFTQDIEDMDFSDRENKPSVESKTASTPVKAAPAKPASTPSVSSGGSDYRAWPETQGLRYGAHKDELVKNLDNTQLAPYIAKAADSVEKDDQFAPSNKGFLRAALGSLKDRSLPYDEALYKLVYG